MRAVDETVLGLYLKGKPRPHFTMVVTVGIVDDELFGHQPITDVLTVFADFSDSVIASFD